MIDLYYEKYKIKITDEKNRYEKMMKGDISRGSQTMVAYQKSQIAKTVERHTTNSMIFVSLLDSMDNRKTYMYDTGLLYGNVDISHFSYRIKTDRDNNSVSLYMQASDSQEKRNGVTIINNLNEVILREKQKIIEVMPK